MKLINFTYEDFFKYFWCTLDDQDQPAFLSRKPWKQFGDNCVQLDGLDLMYAVVQLGICEPGNDLPDNEFIEVVKNFTMIATKVTIWMLAHLKSKMIVICDDVTTSWLYPIGLSHRHGIARDEVDNNFAKIARYYDEFVATNDITEIAMLNDPSEFVMMFGNKHI